MKPLGKNCSSLEIEAQVVKHRDEALVASFMREVDSLRDLRAIMICRWCAVFAATAMINIVIAGIVSDHTGRYPWSGWFSGGALVLTFFVYLVTRLRDKTRAMKADKRRELEGALAANVRHQDYLFISRVIAVFERHRKRYACLFIAMSEIALADHDEAKAERYLRHIENGHELLMRAFALLDLANEDSGRASAGEASAFLGLETPLEAFAVSREGAELAEWVKVVIATGLSPA